MNPTDELADYRWLLSEEGRRWIAQVAADPQTLVVQAGRLRKLLSAQRTHLVLEQVELRRRAREKFGEWADRMFLARVGLEQATDRFVAEYKASRFPSDQPVADLCCGIGGDLLGLAGRGPAVGVDLDPVVALLAEANLAVVEGGGPADARAADVASIDLRAFAAWHMDPDRRPQGRRTTHVEYYEPPLAVIERMLVASSQAALKLAPAAEVPDAWAEQAELEWISRDRQCRQLVAWFGSLATRPGQRRATIVASRTGRPLVLRTLQGNEGERLPVAAETGRYVFDPDAAVLAAKLVGTLAAEHRLAALGPSVAYLTGDEPVHDPALACFEVTDVLPFDLKRLKQLLRSRGIGRLEIKKRAVREEPEPLRRQLALTGDRAAVLLLAPVKERTTAILAQRVLEADES
ncbi:MAG: class I SAM-dependent methyltransferase [Thermoguttaceae bacterium]